MTQPNTDHDSFPCPFPDCNKTFDKNAKLKSHLRAIRGSGWDLEHSRNDPLWDQFDNEEFLALHARPKDLSQEERERRRAESNKRCYLRHKPDILERAQKRRGNINSTLQVVVQLFPEADIAEEKVETVVKLAASLNDHHSHFQRVYGTSKKFMQKLEIDDTKITLSTFPSLITFFLPPDSIPDPYNYEFGEFGTTTRLLELLPNYQHYHAASRLIDPDNCSVYSDAQKSLNAAWDLWREVVEAPELKDMRMFDSGSPVAMMEFNSRGDIFNRASECYFEYTRAFIASHVLVRPPTLSVLAFETMLESAGEKIRRQEEELSLLKEAVISLVTTIRKIPPQSEKRKSGRKVKAFVVGSAAEELSGSEKSPAPVEDLPRTRSGRASAQVRWGN